MKTSAVQLFVLSIITLFAVSGCGVAPQLPFTSLYVFPGDGANGASPEAALFQAADGNFFGTTYDGGSANDGAVFRVSTNGVFTRLYSFTNGIDGAYPKGALVQTGDGNLYGTTYGIPGTNYGTIFRITTNGFLTTVWSFGQGSNNGQNPKAGLLLASDGNLYGTTCLGGSNAWGTVFEITTNGAFTELYAFTNGVDGAEPDAGLVQVNGGLLYGTSSFGGGNTNGTIFSITTGGQFTVLYSFTDGSDGAAPVAPLLLANDGNLYGTASEGGANGVGTVFSISTNGAFSSVYSFTDGTDGAYPYGGLVQGGDGNLYGTANEGGYNGDGTVFQLSTSGSFNIVYGFSGTTDGKSPAAGLVQGSDGTLYGTTSTTGIGSPGTIFQIGMPVPTFRDLYSVGYGSDGGTPKARLIQAGDGLLYGTTAVGGTNGGFGTIFNMATNGSINSVYNFSNGIDGSYPEGALMQANDDNLYGAASGGGTNGYGTLFQISTSEALTPLYSFTNGEDGANPTGGLVQASDGNLYGTAASGGSLGYGAFFRLSTSGVFTSLYSFTNGSDGANPNGGLIQATDGYLYGTALYGGSNWGTVFRISTNGALTSLYLFTNGSDGGLPECGLVQASDGILYGSASDGGTNGDGTVFSITTNGAFASLYSFTNGIDGSDPSQVVQANDGILYGTAEYGGADGGYGAVFGITTNGAFASLYSFAGNGDGEFPACGLVQSSDGVLFGACSQGGTESSGTIFSIMTNAVYENLDSFDLYKDGSKPTAPLLESGGLFYGTAAEGGTSGDGTIFDIEIEYYGPAPYGEFTSLYSFTNGIDGANPNGGLVQIGNNLYGTSSDGGTNGDGTVFATTLNGAFTPLYSFTNGGDGAHPYAGLVAASDGNLYGTTSDGGTNGDGSVFCIATNGVFTALHSFNSNIDGARPEAALIQASDGNLYGTAAAGGNGYGTVFRVTTSGQFAVLYEFTNGQDGAAPSGALLQGGDGNLYGTAIQGGLYHVGTVFRITTNGLFAPIYSFTGQFDGSEPRDGLVQGQSGNFFGTSYGGGEYGDGTMFQLTPGGLLTVLRAFTGVLNDGGQPTGGLLVGSDGTLYGMASSGSMAGLGDFFSLGGPYLTQPGSPAVGSLQVTIAPSAAGTDGAQWQIDGGPWMESGETVTNLAVGAYQVCFSNINNWTAPDCQFVQVYANETNAVTFDYETNFTLAVNASPPSAGNVTGAGIFASNTSVTVTASALDGYAFSDWTVEGTNVSSTATYNFTLTNNETLVANFLPTNVQMAVLLGGSSISGTVNFGSVLQNSSGPIKIFTITNSGNATLNLGAPTVPSGFAVLTNPPASIAAGSSGTFAVQLSTSTPNAYSGNIRIANNSPNNPFLIAVAGTVISLGPQIQVWQGTNLLTNNESPAVSFGSVSLNEPGPILSFTVSNIGAESLGVSNLSVPTNFTLITNLATNLIPAGSNGEFAVQLKTTIAGILSGDITLTNGDTNHNPFVIPVTGTVTAPISPAAPIIALSGPLDFGVVPLGSAKTNSITISNAGSSNLTVSAINFPGAVFSPTWSSGSIAPGSNQEVSIVFSPLIATNYSGIVTVVSDAASGTSNLVVTAFSADTESNKSWRLTLITNPPNFGKITPNDAKLIKNGTKVSLKAVATDSSAIFVNWTGSYNTNANPFVFKMTNDTIVQANFTNNPFPSLAGSYNGLFWAGQNVSSNGSGFLKALQLTTEGAYSGSLLVDGRSASISGSFDPVALLSSAPAKLGGTEGAVLVSMQLISNETAPQITGSVSNSQQDWVATNLLAYRAASSGVSASNYTLIIQPDTNVISSPGGYGYALIAVSPAKSKPPATATISGQLADGSSYSQTVGVTADGQAPVYAGVDGGKGFLLGWINLTNSGGPLYWVHPKVSAHNAPFPTEFVATNPIAIANWSSAADGYSQLFNNTNYNLYEYAGLETNALTNFSVNISSTTGKYSSDDGSVTVTLKTGKLSVTIGKGSKKVAGTGAMLLDGTNTAGYGFFTTPTTNGAFLLQQ